jgi:hypothetical protein
MDVINVVIGKLGYDGWVNLEIVNVELLSEDESIPAQYAERGQACWNNMQQKLSRSYSAV